MQKIINLNDVVEAQRIDMGQCMCPTNCVKRKADSRELTQEVENVYTRTRNKAA